MQCDGIAAVAKDALSFFMVDERTDGSRFVRLTEGAPEWVSDMVRAAHGSYLPDDWKYETIRDAVEWVAEGNDPGDFAEFADGRVDAYHSDALRWLASGVYRASYCDLADDEFGPADPDSLMNRVARGQYYEAHDIAGQVVYELREELERRESTWRGLNGPDGIAVMPGESHDL